MRALLLIGLILSTPLLGDEGLFLKVKAMERSKEHYAGLYQELKAAIPLNQKSCFLDRDKKMAKELLLIEAKRFAIELSSLKRDKFILVHLLSALLHRSIKNEETIKGTPILFDYQESLTPSPFHHYLIGVIEKYKIPNLTDKSELEHYFEKNRHTIKIVAHKLQDDPKAHQMAREAINLYFERQNRVSKEICEKKIVELTAQSYPAYNLLGIDTQKIGKPSTAISELISGGWHSFAEFYREQGEGRTNHLIGESNRPLPTLELHLLSQIYKKSSKVERRLATETIQFTKSELLSIFKRTPSGAQYCIKDLIDIYSIESFNSEREKRRSHYLQERLTPIGDRLIFKALSPEKRPLVITISQNKESGLIKTEILGEDALPFRLIEKRVNPHGICQKIEALLSEILEEEERELGPY